MGSHLELATDRQVGRAAEVMLLSIGAGSGGAGAIPIEDWPLNFESLPGTLAVVGGENRRVDVHKAQILKVVCAGGG